MQINMIIKGPRRSQQEGQPCGYVDVRLGADGQAQQKADVTLLEPAGVSSAQRAFISTAKNHANHSVAGSPPLCLVSRFVSAAKIEGDL